MATNLGIPPWLQGQDIPGSFLKGAQLGQEQARMEQESQRLQVQSQQAQQQTLQEQQRLEIQHQYQQQQIALQKQDLEQAKQMNQIKVQEAARQSQAMLAYQSGMAQLEARTDLTEEQKQKARIGLMMQHGPNMSEGRMSGLGTMLAATAKQAPPPSLQFEEDPTTHKRFAYVPGHPPIEEKPEPTAKETVDQKRVDSLIDMHKRAYDTATKTYIEATSPKIQEQADAERKAALQAIEELQSGTPGKNTHIKPIPDPSTPSGYRLPPGYKGKSSGTSTGSTAAPPPQSGPAPIPSTFKGQDPGIGVFGQTAPLKMPQPAPPTPANAPAPKPQAAQYPEAPKDPKDRVRGHWYMTEDGPAEWNKGALSGKVGWVLDPKAFFRKFGKNLTSADGWVV